MSMNAFRWAKSEVVRRFDDGQPLSASETVLLLMIADHYNDEWARSWPSQTTLAKETGLSESTVKRSTQQLVELGVVTIEHWQMNEGGWAHNRYLLPLHRPKVHGSGEPVLVFSGWADMSGDYDGVMRVPGSNLMIETDSIDMGHPVFR